MTEEEFRFKDMRPGPSTGWPALDLRGKSIAGRGPLPPGTIVDYVVGPDVYASGIVGDDGITIKPRPKSTFDDKAKSELERRKEILKGNFALHIRRARDKTFGGVGDRLGECLDAARTAIEYYKLTGEPIA